MFFLSGTGTISLKREGEDSRIVTRLGEGSKVYSTMRLQNDWIVFTEDGSYVFNLKTHQVSLDTELNIKKGQVQIDNRGIFGFIIIRVRYGMSMPRPDLSSLSN